MIYRQPYRPAGRQVVLGVILAVLLGVLTPLMTVLEATLLMPVVLLNGVFMVFLYGYGGRLPAWLYMTIQLGAAAVTLDSTFMWMSMAAGTFPAILALRGILLKRPFFEQLKTDIVIYLSGLVAAILIARLTFGGNMLGRAMEALQDQFRRMPDELFSPFLDVINGTLSGGSVPGASGMTVTEYRERIMAVLELVGETYEQALPGRFFSGAALSGVLTALWGNWLMARHGMATDESYIGLSRWFLPRQAVVGLLLMWVAAFAISETGYHAGSAVYMAAYDMVSMAFYIQALGAVDRFFFRRGVSAHKRHALVAVVLVFGLLLRLFNTFLFIVGVSSALFGSHGVMKRRPFNDDGNSFE